MSGFTGFGEAVVDFYDGLEVDNSKAYWTDHKAVYESDVRAPMQALVAALEPDFGSGKIFRPYRDVRFSRDKTPYKDHTGAVVHPPGQRANDGLYIQISAEGLLVACKDGGGRPYDCGHG